MAKQLRGDWTRFLTIFQPRKQLPFMALTVRFEDQKRVAAPAHDIHRNPYFPNSIPLEVHNEIHSSGSFRAVRPGVLFRLAVNASWSANGGHGRVIDHGF
jgi:hypothetical protein